MDTIKDIIEKKANQTEVDKITAGFTASSPEQAAKKKSTSDQQVVLHQWDISPYCSKIRKVLEAKNIPYTVVNYNGLRTLKANRLTPVGKLPVLDIDGQRIQDSRKISAYLEEHYTDVPLFPIDNALRADVEIYQDWADESLYWYEVYFRAMYKDAWASAAAMMCEGRSAFETACLKLTARYLFKLCLMAQGIGRYPNYDVENRFKKLMNQLNDKLADREWLVGDSKTLADIAVAAQLQEILRTSHLAEYMRSLSNLNRWIQQV